MQVIKNAKAWKFGDNIDTDLIIAARYLNTTDSAVLASHLMEDARNEFVNSITKGDVIVAGENFGCGSSREHAPVAIKAAGISAVIAKSYARIFYRNAFNTGLPILEVKEANSINEGDVLEISLQEGVIKNHTQNCHYTFNAIPPFMLNLLESGGLISYAKNALGSTNANL
ncbi:3-isopropylmalate dehydratase small subunit [uncultured Helicobacter sp.]|uniref:3-isopropylmalate dehydratase small subunit n=1 Tax=uncultured Helicobacter sp. TaxID=175537 RepID=UPI0026134379|nr:3-isopropylmalate dehydratase small subunit [uncultured Helicobacter sp.]